jgi:nucleoside-diphosphate-sugar epimerase
MKKEFILITGSTGFIGKKILIKFLNNKKNIITLHKKKILRTNNKIKNHLQFEFNIKNLNYIFTNYYIKTIIHLAVQYDKSEKKLISLYKSNLIFPSKILSYALKHKVEYFINTDTFYVKYRDHYSLTKKHFKDILFYSRKKIKVVNLELGHVYGPDDNKKKFVPSILNKMDRNLKIPILNPNAYIDFIYIDDVINAYINIINNIDQIEKNFISLYIGSNKKITLKSFLSCLKKEYLNLNPSSKFDFIYDTDEKNNINRGINSVIIKKNSFLEKIKWKTSVDLFKGLKKTIKLKKNYETY